MIRSAEEVRGSRRSANERGDWATPAKAYDHRANQSQLMKSGHCGLMQPQPQPQPIIRHGWAARWEQSGHGRMTILLTTFHCLQECDGIDMDLVTSGAPLGGIPSGQQN